MWYIVIFIATLLIDQITKILVASASGVAGTVEGSKHIFWVIKDFIEITYSENESGAMGIFKGVKNAQIGFIVATVLILGGLFAFLIFSKKKRMPWLNVTLALIIAGAIGNFIDRLTTVYVRDFIHVIIPLGKNGDFFPYIFNVADIALVVGSIMLIIYLLFLDDDAVFKPKKKETEKADEN
ncbi:MAG: signal peptidase II [Clostridia bacterium]|nr:signal peptidase II [Clostridia bacterium]